MFSFAIKHMSNETPGKILASRTIGAVDGTIKPVRKHYDLSTSYLINENRYDAEVQWLEGDATAYINTGIVAKKGVGLHYKGKADDTGAYAYIGASAGTGVRSIRFSPGNVNSGGIRRLRFYVGGTAIALDVGTPTYSTGGGRTAEIKITTSPSTSESKEISAEYDVYGVRGISTYSSSSFPAGSLPIYVFAVNAAGNPNGPNKSRFYFVKLFEDGVLVRDYIPVRIGNVGYMYDKVSKTLCAAEGGGAFTVGPDIDEKIYDSELEYIDLTGNSYLELNYKADDILSVVSEIRTIGTNSMNPTTYIYQVFGSSSGRLDGICYDNNYDQYWCTTGMSAPLCSIFFSKDDRKDPDTSSSPSNRSASYYIFPTATQRRNMLVFAEFSNNRIIPAQHTRSNHFQLWENNETLFDLIPVRIGTSAYWYNDITEELYSSSGTGEFVSGPDVQPYISSENYPSDEPIPVYGNFPSGTYSALSYVPEFAHRRFVGWYDSPSFTNQILSSDSIIYDVSAVYARWQEPTTVTFDATTNGGAMPSAWVSPDYYEGQPYGTLPEPEKDGETFIGWYTSGGTRVTESSSVSSGTLTARYMSISYATTFTVTTTSSYKNTGIYSATRYSSSDPIIVDWGDDTIDIIDGNISQLTHTYSSVGTFTVRISDNISTFAPSYNNSTWYNTTSQNRYTLKTVTALSNKITALTSYAYYYCAALTSVVIPQSASTVPTYCFYYCSSLTGVTLPDSVTSIGDYAFSYSGLRSSSFELPLALKSIGSYAFSNITNSYFTALTIPSLVTNIGQNAFYYCYYLHPVFEYNSTNTLTLGTYAFAYTMYNGSAVTLDLSQRKITSIPASCFYYCRYLKEIIWPYRLTTINASAFRYCFYVAAAEGEIVIPEGVTTIGGTYAFANCSYLTSVTLPSTLGNLNNYTFYYCTRLATIHAHRLTAPTVSAATFGNSSTYYTGRTSYSAGTNRLYVLSGASGYTSSYWSSVLCNASCCGYTLEEMPYFRYYNDDSENNLVFDIRSYYPTTWYNTVFGTVTYNGTVEYVNAYLGQSAREATAESGTTVAGTVLLNTKAEAAKSSISDPVGPSAGSVVGSFLDTGGENLSPESKRTRVILGRAGAWLFGPFRSNQYIGAGYYAEIGVQ